MDLTGNWADAFRQEQRFEDIPARVGKMQERYRFWTMVSSVMIVLGLLAIIGPAVPIQIRLLGLFVAVEGVVSSATVKLWVHIRLTMYWTLWERHQRLERELRQSEAADL